MPEKSVREMSKWERRRYSLAARTFHAVTAMAIVLSVVAILISGWMYYRTVTNQYIQNAYNISAEASSILRETTDAADSVEKVMSKYYAMSQEDLDGQDTAAYQDKFRFLRFDENYQQILSVLKFLKMNNNVEDVYLLALDRERQRAVYVADPEERSDLRCPPGRWVTLKEDYMEVFSPKKGDYIPRFTTNNQYGWMCTSGVPVRDKGGNTVGYILTDISVIGLIRSILLYLLQFALLLALLAFVLSYFFVCHFKKTLVAPINLIAEAAETYVKDRRRGAEVSDHFSRQVLNIKTGDEVENLSLVMADMEKDLNEFEDNLTRAVAEKERVSTELNMATQIQEGMLPNIYPAFPERHEFDIYATMEPAREVGGDFYDFFLVDDDHLGMVMADVSGKGVPAALFMMASKIILANNAMMGKSPAQILADTNAAICSNNRMEMFVTVWLGILEISTGKLTAANAGHEFPVLRRAGGGFELYKDKHGFVIGGLEGMKYQEYEIQLSPGDKVFVYTDGVPEATDGENRMFGTDRMLDALNASLESPPEAVLHAVHQAVNEFVQEAPQFDDLTMLCMEYLGPNPGENP